MLAFVIIFLCFTIAPLVEGNTNKNFSPEFKPHMLDHINEGCPTNSSCLPQTGKRYKQWVDLLKKKSLKGARRWRTLENFRKKNGIPLEVWSFPQAEKIEGLIHWDGHCPNHNQKGHKIQITLALTKNFIELAKLEREKKIYIPRAFLLEMSGTIKEYLVLRGSGPLYLDGDALVYIKETEGAYYGLRIESQGRLSVIPPQTPNHKSQSVECPKALNERFAGHTTPKKLYQGAYCRSFWNQKKKIYQTMIFGWSCN